MSPAATSAGSLFALFMMILARGMDYCPAGSTGEFGEGVFEDKSQQRLSFTTEFEEGCELLACFTCTNMVTGIIEKSFGNNAVKSTENAADGSFCSIANALC
jgi:hypothetical protein